MNELNIEIEMMIYKIQSKNVMLDSDLAKLYGIKTKVLNQAVKRNIQRFPSDFMIECNSSDLESLRSQIVTANNITYWNHKRRTTPLLFTENGVAMLSSVINSEKAISINIAIMRTFTKLRSFLIFESSLDFKMNEFEKDTYRIFKAVFKRLDDIEVQISPVINKNKKKIGIKNT